MNNNIKYYRLKSGLTLKELSGICDISIGYLCHLEKGTRSNPSTNKMYAISKALGKSVSEMFFETPILKIY